MTKEEREYLIGIKRKVDIEKAKSTFNYVKKVFPFGFGYDSALICGLFRIDYNPILTERYVVVSDIVEHLIGSVFPSKECLAIYGDIIKYLNGVETNDN